MSTREMATWLSILAAMATAIAAHFGVANKAGDAEKDAAHVLAQLERHVEDSKEAHKSRERELEALRTQHTRDVEQLRGQADATRERVIVLEQGVGQILSAVTKLEATVERSTLLVPEKRGLRK